MTAKDPTSKLAFLQKRIKGKSAVSGEDKQKPIPPRTSTDPIPLSFAQQRLWFLDQLENGQAAYYHVPSVWSLEGTLHVEAMERSINEIVARHEVLRTTFPLGEEGQPVQVINPPVRVALPVTDLTSYPEAEVRAVADRLIQEEIWRPFDLATEIPQRVRLLRLSAQHHILIWTVHHIVTDGWSLGVVNRELVALYEAFVTSRPSPLPVLPLQYADFSIWQRDWLQGDVLEKQLAYWRKQLGGRLPVLQLPTDRPRPSKQSFKGRFQTFSLSKSLSDDLRAFCQGEGVTMFMTLMSAFQALLGRYANTDDVLVGSTIAGRIRSELESLIGFFVNTLVLRTDLSGDPTFRELVHRARKVSLDAYGHQDVPFEKLVEELQPERDLSQSPMFRVVFSHYNASKEPLQLPGLTMTLVDFEVDSAKFDLSLFFHDMSEEVRFYLEYNTDLFDESTIIRMSEHFKTMLAAVMQQPQLRLSEIPLLSRAEREQLLVEWNDNAIDYGKERTIATAFEQQVERHADRVAAVYEGESLTYAELNARANRLAHLLRKKGVVTNDLVGVFMDRSLDLIVSLLAILKAGAAYVPLDPQYPEERLRFMLEDTGIDVLITQSHLREKMPAANLQILCIEQEEEMLAQESAENVHLSAVTSDALAYVIYTSGSTGLPKGVVVPQRGVLRLVTGQTYVKLDEEEVMLQFAPVSFDVATWDIWGALLNGARLVIAPAGKPTYEELGETIRANGVTTMWLTSALFSQMVVGHIEELRTLRQIMFGGDATPVAHVRKAWEQLPGCRLVNGYGPTENTTFTTCYVVQDGDQLGGSVPIGKPIANTQVYILDEAFQLVPIGVPGELCTGGDGLAYGYWNRPELTEEKFIPNPFVNDPNARLYRTGDLARYLPDGNIEYLGRMDGQVK
ncbi:MAG: non-ribosomal peptide synthetase, partial [Tumebacillaceae bacterium]